MRTTKFVLAAVITLAGSIGSVAAADEFATLKGVNATPMASSELDAVKGLHIHAINPGGVFFLLGQGNTPPAGFYDNDSADNLASGDLVHNGYHGLCVAPMIIPPATSGPGAGLSQC